MGMLEDYTKAKFLGADTNTAMNYAAAKWVLSDNQNEQERQNNNQQENYCQQIYNKENDDDVHYNNRLTWTEEKHTIKINKNGNKILLSTDAISNIDEQLAVMKKIMDITTIGIDKAKKITEGKLQQVEGCNIESLKTKLKAQGFDIREEEISDKEFQEFMHENKSLWQKIFHR